MSKRKRQNSQTTAQLLESVSGQQVIGALPAGSWLLSQAPWHRIPVQKVEEMQKLETIKYIMTLIKVAGNASEWTVEADEGVPWEALNLIRHMVSRLKFDLWATAIDSWICYGWAPYEIVYGKMLTDEGYVRYNIRKLRSLIHTSTLINMDSEMGFDGLQVMFPTSVSLPIVKSLVLTCDRQYDNLFGRSLLGNVEHSFDLYNQTSDNMRIFDSKRHGPRYVVHFPFGTTEVNGAKKNNREIANEMVQQLEQFNVVALGHRPNTAASQLQRAESDWYIETIPMENVSSEFIQQFMYFDKLISRGMGLPERATLEGIFGTKADASNGTDYAIMRIEYLVESMVNQVNAHLVDRLLGLNYHGLKGRVLVKAGTIDKRVAAAAAAMIQNLLATGWGQAVLTERLDIDNILDTSGIPRLKETEENQPLRWAPQEVSETLSQAPPFSASSVLARDGHFDKPNDSERK